MDTHDKSVKPSCYEIEDVKDVPGHEDKGELGAVPVLVYTNSGFESEIRRVVVQITIPQYGWTALWALMATSVALSVSYQNEISNGLVVNTGFINRVGEAGLGAGGARAFEPKHIDAWAGAHTGGFLLMAFLSWIPADYLGRKKSLFLALMLSMVAFLIQLFAHHWSVWLISRLFTGFATGLSQCVTIAYLSEASPTRLRGASLVGYQLASCIGQLFATCTQQLLILTSPSSYRSLLLSQLCFTVPAIIAISFLPESPIWHALNGQTDRARNSFLRLRRGWDDVDTETEYANLIAQLDNDQDHSSRSLFRGSNLRRLLVSTFPLAWSCWLGGPVITRYLTYFFQLAGIIDSFVPEITSNLLLIAGAILAMSLVEKLGRRPLMLWLSPVMIGSMFAVGGLVRFAPGPWSGAVLTSLGCVWVACFGTSIGPLAFVYLGETSNGRLKAETISIATTCAGLLNSIGVYCTPIMIANPTFRLFTAACLFGCVGLAGWAVCYYCIPETRDLSQPELEDLFRKRESGRSVVRPADD